MALCNARAESLLTGKDQLDFLFGQLDSQNWRNNFEDSLRKSLKKGQSLKKVSLIDCNKIMALFTTDEMIEYTNLGNNLKHTKLLHPQQFLSFCE